MRDARMNTKKNIIRRVILRVLHRKKFVIGVLDWKQGLPCDKKTLFSLYNKDLCLWFCTMHKQGSLQLYQILYFMRNYKAKLLIMVFYNLEVKILSTALRACPRFARLFYFGLLFICFVSSTSDIGNKQLT